MTPWDRPSTTNPPASEATTSHDVSPDVASWDERIAHAQAEAETLTREIAWLRAERERIYQEKQEQALSRERENARQERERALASAASTAAARPLPAPSATPETLYIEDAVVRYAVACGTVDVQIALLRARGDAAGGREHSEALLRLADALHEQNDASTQLRRVARDIQQARGDHSSETGSPP